MSSNKSILLVDDEADILVVVSMQLKHCGFQISTANSGQEAINKTRTQKFDLIILDINMPEMDGFETCCHIKADPHTRNIPVIMFTAMTDRDSVMQAVKSGAENYCIKSAEMEVLVKKIEQTLKLNVSGKERIDRQEMPDIKLSRDKVNTLVKNFKAIPISSHMQKVWNQIIGQENNKENKITAFLELAPLLMARVLCKSGEHDAYSQVDHLVAKDAIHRLGTSNVTILMKAMVPDVEMVSASSSDPLRIWRFQKHALFCASLAEEIAIRNDHPNVHKAFTVGLLHDVGKYVLVRSFPVEYEQVISQSIINKVPLRVMEKRVFGVDHAFVGYRLLESWRFTKDIQFGVFHHHHQSIHLSYGQKEKNDLARFAYFADLMTKAVGIGFSGDVFIEKVPSDFWEFIELNQAEALDMMQRVYLKINSNIALLDIDDEELEEEMAFRKRCADKKVIIFHNASEHVSLIVLTFAFRDVDVIQVTNSNQLIMALEANPKVPLILDERGEMDNSQLRNEKVKDHVGKRNVLTFASEADKSLSSDFPQLKFAKKPIPFEDILEGVFN